MADRRPDVVPPDRHADRSSPQPHHSLPRHLVLGPSLARPRRAYAPPVSLDRLGEVALQARDLATARARFEEELVIHRRLAEDFPTAQAQHDLGASLDRLGLVAEKAGDLATARAYYTELIPIMRALAKDFTSATTQCDLVSSLLRLGRVTRDRKLLSEALAITLELERTRRLTDRRLLERSSEVR